MNRRGLLCRLRFLQQTGGSGCLKLRDTRHLISSALLLRLLLNRPGLMLRCSKLLLLLMGCSCLLCRLRGCLTERPIERIADCLLRRNLRAFLFSLFCLFCGNPCRTLALPGRFLRLKFRQLFCYIRLDRLNLQTAPRTERKLIRYFRMTFRTNHKKSLLFYLNNLSFMGRLFSRFK